ncbi:MAG TPA: NADH-quinone oxidoreductase subunit N [Acidimicrobiaceae bacterium]|nr:NADH-quinone oxidoreductase subunit N [Acidimicrobiaceae bacterium]
MIASLFAQVDPSMLRGGDVAAETLDSGIVQVAGPSIDWLALLPLIILLVGGLLTLTFSSFLKKREPKGLFTMTTVAIAVAAAISSLPMWARVQGWDSLLWWNIDQSQTGPFSTAGGAVGIDGFSLFITIVLCLGVVLAALLADSFLRRESMTGPEFYVLLLLSAVGGVIMAMSNDLIVLFIGLETLSIAVYVLAGMNLRRVQSQESGLKYFILGAFSSAFLLYGIAMLYGATGSTNFADIRDFMSAVVPIHNGLLLVGLVLVLVGLAFKISAVPFHAWSPDVYDGAPTPATAWMASGVKAAAVAGLVRVFMLTFPNYASTWKPIVYVLAVLSMVVGAALAIVQSNVKRMLAYSSISHAGFILMAIQANSANGITAAAFYVAVYTFMVAGSFGVVAIVGRKGDGNHQLSDYNGLARSNPLLAGSFIVMLLAQAGVPFTAGFFAKFLSITAAADAHAVPLAIIAMVSAVISAFLYLRIIVAMFMSGGDDGTEAVIDRSKRLHVPFAAGLAIAICVVVTIGYGLFPDLLLDPARDATPAAVHAAPPTDSLNLGAAGSTSGSTTAGR